MNCVHPRQSRSEEAAARVHPSLGISLVMFGANPFRSCDGDRPGGGVALPLICTMDTDKAERQSCTGRSACAPRAWELQGLGAVGTDRGHSWQKKSFTADLRGWTRIKSGKVKAKPHRQECLCSTAGGASTPLRAKSARNGDPGLCHMCMGNPSGPGRD
jgi:hypothetical protein